MNLFLFVDYNQSYLNKLLIDYCKELELNVLNIFSQANPYSEEI